MKGRWLNKLIKVCVIIGLLGFSSERRIPLRESRAKHPLIYQLSTRPWLHELSEAYGEKIQTLAEIPDIELQKIARNGTDYLYLLGVWQVGEYGINHDRTDKELIKEYRQYLPDFKEEDAYGCPFSITEYECHKELCPNGDADLKAFRNRIAKLGLKLMLDYVPNHSAYDSPWIENKELYIHAPKGTPEPYDRTKYFENGVCYGGMKGFSWTDVAQLNYWNEETRKLMKERLKYVASMCDGIRVDTTFSVFNDVVEENWGDVLKELGYSKPQTEFFADAIKDIKIEYPNVIFVAETYGDHYIECTKEGFDFSYDHQLYTLLEKEDIDGIKDFIQKIEIYNPYMVRYLENHDFNRAVALFKGSIRKTKAAALIAYTLPGMRFLFQDYFNGYKNKLDIHLLRSAKENPSAEMGKFFNEFLRIISDNVFRNGEWKYVEVSSPLIAWKWTEPSTREFRLVVTNFSPNKVWGKVVVKDIEGTGYVEMKDELTQKEYVHSIEKIKTEGFPITINEYSGQILSIKKSNNHLI